MEYLEAFRDPQLAPPLLAELRKRVKRPLHIMEICGGHTHALFRHGLPQVLPKNLRLVHGPGCPVCVIPRERVDQTLELARREGVTLATFADMVRVPGSRGSLQEARARGADVHLVYSSLDALELARRHPQRQVVFLAIGFETTAPTNALAVRMAREERLRNFTVLSAQVTVPAALRALLASPDIRLDGFLAPGHVSLVTGSNAFAFLPRDYGKAVVVSGFEPLDILQALVMLARQLDDGPITVENQYSRAVSLQGNTKAQAIMEQVFEPCDVRWRGLGLIPQSGLRLRAAYRDFDAEQRFALQPPRPLEDPQACACGDILRGVKTPRDCAVFGMGCTPDRPLGACMVSSEGACAAYYQYARHLTASGESAS